MEVSLFPQVHYLLLLGYYIKTHYSNPKHLKRQMSSFYHHLKTL
uniref:Uncharacterized protein n=1 Tax=Lepeophtheirus salmonis TaxID=72036 RepID=A0A0K2V4X2_LEPSM